MGFEDEGTMVSSAASDKMGGDDPLASGASPDMLPGDPGGDGLAAGGDWASPSPDGGMADNTSVGPVDVCS